MIIQHKNYNCRVKFGRYLNGNVAIQLIGVEGTDYEHELVAMATVNGTEKLPDNIVGVKTWSENEGMVETLVNGNVIDPEFLGLEPTGFVAIEYYKLTDE